MKCIQLDFFFLSIAVALYGQHAILWNNIQVFKKRYIISMPASSQVLFVGSSFFVVTTGVYHEKLNPGGTLMEDIIVIDNLRMNANGNGSLLIESINN